MNFVYRDLAGPSLAPGGSVLCIGAFDGVHLGHRALLTCVRERADALGLIPVAISFEPIPRAYFSHGRPLPRLAGVRDKIRLIADCGIERLLLLHFDEALAAMTAQDFVDRVIVARCGAREIRVGADFRFGHARRGDVATLRAAGSVSGFAVETFPNVKVDGARVSSSTIRAQLAAGEFDAAARGLGRRFAIGGRVVRGRQLGRRLGYPTANLPLGRRAVPLDGIFAVRVHGIGPNARAGVASLGVRPTIAAEDGDRHGVEPVLEAHLFDFEDDLYGRRINVEFVAKLRDEEKFADLDRLRVQMERDATAARQILARGVDENAKSGSDLRQRPQPGRIPAFAAMMSDWRSRQPLTTNR
ncbi:MAG: bifunctional riboflavin kinase/FAD synthetase [Rhodanobacteraceae bacterium]